MTERITAAAVLFEGIVCALPPPARHHTILHIIARDLRPDAPVIGPDAQGFVTSEGRFIGREEARRIAETAGQLLPTAIAHKHLFSEDVW